MKAREWRLVRRPDGIPTENDFALADVDLGPIGPGEVLVINEWVSIDPGARGRFNDGGSYAPGVPLGTRVTGRAVGVVYESRDPAVPSGATVEHLGGWSDAVVLPAGEVKVLDVGRAPAATWLDELGVPGFTAWLAVTEIGHLGAGETFYVSSAAGAVGSVAGQIARLCGAAMVIGSAGSGAKVAWLTGELGFNAAFDYHVETVAEALARLAPGGVDVAVDNVGGATFEGIFANLRRGGRIAMSGTISDYNGSPAPVQINVRRFVPERLSVRGFVAYDYEHRRTDFVDAMSAWLAAGEIRTKRHVFAGLDRAPLAFRSLFDGSTTGKTLVQVN